MTYNAAVVAFNMAIKHIYYIIYIPIQAHNQDFDNESFLILYLNTTCSRFYSFYSTVIINLHININVPNSKYEIEPHYYKCCTNLNLISTKNLFFVIRINMIQKEGSLNPPGYATFYVYIIIHPKIIRTQTHSKQIKRPLNR